MSPIRVGRYTPPSEDEYTPRRGGRGNINRGFNTPVPPATSPTPSQINPNGQQINPIAAGYYGSPNFNAEVEAVAAPARDEQNLRQIFLTDPKFSKFVQEGKKIMDANGRPLSGTALSSYVMDRALSGINFGGYGKKSNPSTTGTVTTQTQTNAPLMSALTQYANNMGSNTGMNSINDLYSQLLASTQSSGQSQQDSISNLYGQLLTDTETRGQSQQDAINKFYGGAEAQLGGLNADALAMLERMYNQTAGEINTQSDAGRATIDETTQRALEALGGQSNPYAGLQMLNAPAVSDPMAAYSQAVGAPQGGIQALQDMLQSQNATTGGGFNNLAQLLGASQQAAQQSRIGDVNVARAGAQQDLSANQRAAALQALQQSTQARQAQQGTYMQQLLGLGQNRLQANLGAEQNTSNLLSQLAQSQLQANLGSQENTGNLLSQLQQSQLQSQLGQQQNTQGRQAELMQQLLGLAGQGVDVSQIMALLGGQ